ncbi:hypothetical protein JCM10914A_32710 [Paenibacillus sp. JCM 10914]|uniref:YhcN/YlaJ family sporulation lipoprotein n=1 Tax=Paenibacillus sp. JCM 10914 TaxID=1236974 RepID=UPI0003CC69DB|nr:hypothetical protein [Paenibacillus sp. JCM 10914]GAE07541.1 hypothetical protein JCM10914_3776 [Paenibacillus sp. JCM 10914]
MMKSKAVTLTVSTALLLSMAAVTGCGNANDGNTTRTNSVDGGRVGVHSVRNNQNMTGSQQHDLTNLKYSNVLSKKVTDIEGVGTAHVFVTNRSAYVSISKDGVNTSNINGHVTGISKGTRANSTIDRNTTGIRTNTGKTRLNGNMSTSSVGLLRGMANETRHTVEKDIGLGRSADNRGFGLNGTTRKGGFGGSSYNTLNGTRTNGLMGTNGTRTGMAGTDGTLNDSYMGTGINGAPYGTYNHNNMGIMSNKDEVSQHVRQEITSKIRKTAPHISQVYVSTDEEFHQHAAGYVTGDNAKNTLGTLSRDFGSWINRIFPMNLGARDGMNDTRGNLIKNDTDDGWFGGNRNMR